MTMLERLPTEIGLLIVTLCDDDTIRCCLQVPGLRDLAQSIVRAEPSRFLATVSSVSAFVDLLKTDEAIARQVRTFGFRGRAFQTPRPQLRGRRLLPWSRWECPSIEIGGDGSSIVLENGRSGIPAYPMGQVMHVLHSCVALKSLFITSRIQVDYEVVRVAVEESQDKSEHSLGIHDGHLYVSDESARSWAGANIVRVEPSEFIDACLALTNLTTLVIHRAKWLTKDQGMMLLQHRLDYKDGKPHWKDRRHKWQLFELMNCAGRMGITFSIYCKEVKRKSKRPHVVKIDGREEIVKMY